MQVRYIGNHLRDCSCSTQAARDWIAELAEIIREAAASPALAPEASP